MKKLLLILALGLGVLNAEVFVFGPGGPAPVIKEAAAKFEAKTGIKVNVVAGPANVWMNDAKQKADLVFSGGSFMMDNFAKSLDLQMNELSVLNIRPAGLVVREDSAKNIKSFDDILKPGVSVMVVDGSGQIGLYEDMALRGGKAENLAKLRKNITKYAANSKIAVDEWNANANIDALIIWSHWSKALSGAKFVQDEKAVIYRASEIAPTKKGLTNKEAGEFVKFLQSDEAKEIWKNNLWE